MCIRDRGQEVGEVDLEDAELVGPRIAEYSEGVAAFLLVLEAGGADAFESADLGLDVVGFRGRGASAPCASSSRWCADYSNSYFATHRTEPMLIGWGSTRRQDFPKGRVEIWALDRGLN